MRILIEHLQKAFGLTADLAKGLSSEALRLKLKELPSNTIGEQMWCIVGARESYLRAIVNEGWVGFSCTLDDASSKEKVLQCLELSAEESINFLNDIKPSEKQLELMITLLEHEVQHHGQLIRYVFGNNLNFPESWKKRYTV